MIVERVEHSIPSGRVCAECAAEMMTINPSVPLLAVKIGARLKVILCGRHVEKLLELARAVLP